MEYKILFTEDALIDLEVLLDYIRDDNPEAATRFGAALLDSLQILQSFPKLGTPSARPHLVKAALAASESLFDPRRSQPSLG